MHYQILLKKIVTPIIGLISNQGIKVIPWKAIGLVLGLSVFETIQTSKVYKTNLGFALELRVNF